MTDFKQLHDILSTYGEHFCLDAWNQTLNTHLELGGTVVGFLEGYCQWCAFNNQKTYVPQGANGFRKHQMFYNNRPKNMPAKAIIMYYDALCEVGKHPAISGKKEWRFIEAEWSMDEEVLFSERANGLSHKSANYEENLCLALEVLSAEDENEAVQLIENKYLIDK